MPRRAPEGGRPCLAEPDDGIDERLHIASVRPAESALFGGISKNPSP